MCERGLGNLAGYVRSTKERYCLEGNSVKTEVVHSNGAVNVAEEIQYYFPARPTVKNSEGEEVLVEQRTPDKMYVFTLEAEVSESFEPNDPQR